jgi:hypothetical protein
MRAEEGKRAEKGAKTNCFSSLRIPSKTEFDKRKRYRETKRERERERKT